jgi:5-methylthioadenosine/S-adenosylhomocysteine deaminase
MLAITEMIKSGTTCFMDMYFFMNEVAQAVERTGIRAVLSRGMIGVGPSDELAMTESRELAGKWHGRECNRIQVKLGPHAPYTCPPEYLRKVIGIASELGLGLNIHVAETAAERADIIKQYGLSPVKHLEACGIFQRPVVAAHCVHVDEEDIAILKKYRVGVVHNPESNMKLASGIAPVPEMLAAGIPVALGTDGASSNNDLDMLQEMRTCAFLHKVNKMDPTVLPAYQALEMATRNGGMALGLEQEIGELRPGMKADMVIMDLSQAHMIPRYDIAANIVYAAQASDVETVIIDGNIVMENRKILTFDEAEVLEQAKKCAARLVNS